VCEDRDLLRLLNVRKDAVTLNEVWERMLDAFPPDDSAREWTDHLQTILRHGPLARRQLVAAGADPDRADLRRVADALGRCLAENSSFTPDV
jgi:hypothetical protein